MRLNSKQICEYTGGTMLVEPIDSSALACGITWDSRQVEPGYVYVALQGARVDGHEFVADALRAGALIVLVTEKLHNDVSLLAREMGAAVIEVSNPEAAIVDIARAWRKALQGKVLALTGSTGKTTTKNLVRDVLKASFKVVATEGNQNNELGVPKTILSAEPETQVVIVEMGMRGIGQIADLCDYVLPDMGLITNIGEGHIELLGSVENIAQAKAELFEALPDGKGKAFLNKDDRFSEAIQERSRLAQRRIELSWFDGSDDAKLHHESFYQQKEENEDAHPFENWGAWAEQVSLDEQGRPHFILHIGQESRECSVPLRGAHNVHNAMAAASVGASLGMDIDTIVSALAQTEPECGRQEVHNSREGFTVIDDTYNANPDSMRASLLMLSSYQTMGRRVAVLGDMGELGAFAQVCHEGVGELIADLPVDHLVCIGELSCHIASASIRAGMEQGNVVCVSSIADALTELEAYLLPKDVVLVKASRFMGLERIVGGLVN